MRKALGLFVYDTHKNDEIEINELKALARTIQIEIVEVFSQRRSMRNQTLIGFGKMEELKSVIDNRHIDCLIINQAISPLHTKQLEQYLQVEIVDKATLVLQIFSLRAQSKLSKMHVELAQTQLALSRLSGTYTMLSRQGGASGSMAAKGAGEQQLQLDRRILSRKITRLKESIKNESIKREVTRKNRKIKQLFTVALIGYTNAGKSTLLNQFLKLSKENKAHKEVLSQNQVFSSLETTTRLIDIASYSPFLCVDTVGFISDLPEACVDSFKSTLSESKQADCVVIVLDASSEMFKQKEAIESMIQSFDFKHKIIAINKSDLVAEQSMINQGLTISALNPTTLTQLLEAIMEAKFDSDLEVSGLMKEEEYFELKRFPESVYIKEHIPQKNRHYIKAKIKEPYRYLELLFDQT